jgi:hypothetical protein
MSEYVLVAIFYILARLLIAGVSFVIMYRWLFSQPKEVLVCWAVAIGYYFGGRIGVPFEITDALSCLASLIVGCTLWIVDEIRKMQK